MTDLNKEYYTTSQSFLVVFDSRTASQLYNGSNNSHLRFDLEQSVTFDTRSICNYCSVIQFNGANSLYNINETNALLSITVNGSTYNYSFGYGNYNAATFMTVFTTLFGYLGFSISFNKITGIFTLTNTLYNFTINANSTIYSVMGFSKNTVYNSTIKALTFPYTCNFNGIQNFNIHIDNLGTQNFDSYNGSYSTVIQSIPVNPNDTNINFIRQFDFNFRVFLSTIDYFEISLMDNLENYLNLNNCQWNMTLCFTSIINLDKFQYESFHGILGNAPQKGYLMKNDVEQEMDDGDA
jgi:hypothetical protein